MSVLIGFVILSATTFDPAARFEAVPVEPPPLFAAILEDPPPPVMHRWTGAVSAGASISSGNTDKETASATGDVEYRREKDRTSFNLLWNYSSEDGIGVTERRVYGMGKYDYFLSKRAYALASLSGEYNYAAQLDLRSIASVGAGYQFLETATSKLSGEAGLAYVDESYFSSADDAEYVAARLAYKLDFKFGEKVELAQTGEVVPSLEDSEDVSSKLDTRLQLTLTKAMFAQLQHLWTWDNTPATGADRSDHLLLLSLGWKF